MIEPQVKPEPKRQTSGHGGSPTSPKGRDVSWSLQFSSTIRSRLKPTMYILPWGFQGFFVRLNHSLFWQYCIMLVYFSMYLRRGKHERMHIMYVNSMVWPSHADSPCGRRGGCWRYAIEAINKEDFIIISQSVHNKFYVMP